MHSKSTTVSAGTMVKCTVYHGNKEYIAVRFLVCTIEAAISRLNTSLPNSHIIPFVKKKKTKQKNRGTV